MKKIGKHIFGCFVSILIMSVFWLHPVYADNTVAQLTLHAYGKSTITGSSAGGDFGHTFLSIKNKTNSTLNFLDYPIPAKEMITVSIWREGITSIGSGGIYINLEMTLCKNVDNASISIDITQQQLDLIAKNSPKESYYKHDLSHAIWHNCTTYSTKMWNLVAPKKYKVTDGILGADAPKWVAEKINKMSGHQNGSFIVKRNIDSGDVFHVTKNKELVPVGFKVPNLYNSKVSKNSVSLNWSSSKKWLLNEQTNITGYEVKYSLSDGSQTKTKTFSSEGGTISGLKYGKRYKCQVRALYKKGNYNLCSKYSNTVSFTTSKAPKASIKLNKAKFTIYKGKTATLKATVTGASTKVKWKSSNSSIAVVNSKGKITAKKAGTCKITATANGKKATCTVTVKNKSKKYIDIEKVSNMTAPKAAAVLGLNRRISNTHDVFYTKNGRTGDGSSYIWCSQIDITEKGMWTFYAMDKSISLYGAKVGMSKNAVHSTLLKRGWQKSSDSINNVMHTGILGYDKGVYHLVVTIRNNKVLRMSYYNTDHAW
ncbi:Ig domain-containing protein [Blautia sp. 1033sp1_1033st1_G9_1033SCRN_220408]|uniref:Ig domain-containing protein n=1 Tax=Blautia sp. 1033sp1_1033st1_G9_1033SCRN_220408 TaxID=3144490 RepID=UPI0034A42700